MSQDKKRELVTHRNKTSSDARKKITADQIEVLCSFFEENPEVITGYRRTSDSLVTVREKWKAITKTLNILGPPKSYQDWSKYLSNMKTKLKNMRIKWRQSSDGMEPIICNVDDFDVLKLRMLQVLRNEQGEQDLNYESIGSDSCLDLTQQQRRLVAEKVLKTLIAVYPADSENSIGSENEKYEDNESMASSRVSIDIELSPEYDEGTGGTESEVVEGAGDAFAKFGMDVAHQLRFMPRRLARETQEMLLSVLHSQRKKTFAKRRKT